MKIPEKEWKTFSCIISVPDVFIRHHIKQLISMIFSKICFSRLYLHLESVLACLGTAISSAVVVDIGHEKINVCCVDEGVILPKTLIRKNFGLKNVTKTMIKLFNSRINEEGYDLSTNSEADIGQVDQIK
jgi:actin-related protein 8